MAGTSSKAAGAKAGPGSRPHCRRTSRDVPDSAGHRERLTKSDRLRRRPQFLRVQGGGRKIHTRSLLILVRPNRSGRRRLGIAVSKKYGNSVRRNRIKRLIRELFRRNRDLFPAASDLVIVPKRVSHPVSYRILCAELTAWAGRA